jgi:hypothetical protein
MKTYGNVILTTAICIVIFWVFMALRPAQAQQFIGTRGAGVGHYLPATPTREFLACYRANYASTVALERANCTRFLTAGPKRGRR